MTHLMGLGIHIPLSSLPSSSCNPLPPTHTRFPQPRMDYLSNLPLSSSSASDQWKFGPPGIPVVTPAKARARLRSFLPAAVGSGEEIRPLAVSEVKSLVKAELQPLVKAKAEAGMQLEIQSEMQPLSETQEAEASPQPDTQPQPQQEMEAPPQTQQETEAPPQPQPKDVHVIVNLAGKKRKVSINLPLLPSSQRFLDLDDVCPHSFRMPASFGPWDEQDEQPSPRILRWMSPHRSSPAPRERREKTRVRVRIPSAAAWADFHQARIDAVLLALASPDEIPRENSHIIFTCAPPPPPPPRAISPLNAMAPVFHAAVKLNPQSREFVSRTVSAPAVVPQHDHVSVVAPEPVVSIKSRGRAYTSVARDEPHAQETANKSLDGPKHIAFCPAQEDFYDYSPFAHDISPLTKTAGGTKLPQSSSVGMSSSAIQPFKFSPDMRLTRASSEPPATLQKVGTFADNNAIVASASFNLAYSNWNEPDQVDDWNELEDDASMSPFTLAAVQQNDAPTWTQEQTPSRQPSLQVRRWSASSVSDEEDENEIDSEHLEMKIDFSASEEIFLDETSLAGPQIDSAGPSLPRSIDIEDLMDQPPELEISHSSVSSAASSPVILTPVCNQENVTFPRIIRPSGTFRTDPDAAAEELVEGILRLLEDKLSAISKTPASAINTIDAVGETDWEAIKALVKSGNDSVIAECRQMIAQPPSAAWMQTLSNTIIPQIKTPAVTPIDTLALVAQIVSALRPPSGHEPITSANIEKYLPHQPSSRELAQEIAQYLPRADDIKDAAAALVDARKEIIEKSTELERFSVAVDLNAELQLEVGNLRAALAKSEGEKEALLDRVMSLEAERDASSMEAEMCRSVVRLRDEEISKADSTNSNLISSTEVMSERLKESHTELNLFKARERGWYEADRDYQVQIMRLQSDLANLQSASENSSALIKDLKQDVIESRTCSRETEQSMRALLRDFQAQLPLMAEARERASKLESERTSSEREVKRMREEIERRDQAWSVERDELKTEIKCLTASLSQRPQDFAQQIDGLRQEMQQFKNSLRAEGPRFPISRNISPAETPDLIEQQGLAMQRMAKASLALPQDSNGTVLVAPSPLRIHKNGHARSQSHCAGVADRPARDWTPLPFSLSRVPSLTRSDTLPPNINMSNVSASRPVSRPASLIYSTTASIPVQSNTEPSSSDNEPVSIRKQLNTSPRKPLRRRPITLHIDSGTDFAGQVENSFPFGSPGRPCKSPARPDSKVLAPVSPNVVLPPFSALKLSGDDKTWWQSPSAK